MASCGSIEIVLPGMIGCKENLRNIVGKASEDTVGVVEIAQQ